MMYVCTFNLDCRIEKKQEMNWKAKFWLDSQGIPYEEIGVCSERYIVASLTKKQFKEICKAIECDQLDVYF